MPDLGAAPYEYGLGSMGCWCRMNRVPTMAGPYSFSLASSWHSAGRVRTRLKDFPPQKKNMFQIKLYKHSHPMPKKQLRTLLAKMISFYILYEFWRTSVIFSALIKNLSNSLSGTIVTTKKLESWNVRQISKPGWNCWTWIRKMSSSTI